MKQEFSKIINLFKTGITVVQPRNLIAGCIRFENDELSITDVENVVSTYDLSKYKNVFVIGAGKASASMAFALEELMYDRITEGVVVTKYGFGKKLRKIWLMEAGHPVPDESGFFAAIEVVDLCRQAGRNDLVINLLSGGASALLPFSVGEILLSDKMKVTNLLLKSGATIEEMNLVRKHLSQIKGGGLLRHIYPADVVSLIISDVIGDKLGVIGSGITHREEKSYRKCWEIIEKYNLQKSLPKKVLDFLHKRVRQKTGKRKSKRYPRNVKNIIIGNNGIVLKKVKSEAEKRGFISKIVTATLAGEAKDVGKKIAADAKNFKDNKAGKNKKYCFIYGGETTVTVKGKGKGGRNQELALAAAIELENTKGITILSGGTDGNDGPTDAAGAVCNGDTVKTGKKAGISASGYLDNNDSYNYFKKNGGLLVTGATGTNVMDLVVVFVDGGEA